MKSLRRIQVLYKVAKILCWVFFGLCIAAAVGSTIGLIVIPASKDLTISEGKTVADLIAESGLSVNAAMTYCAFGIVHAAAGAVVSVFLANYCKDVLAIGTPFTRPLLKKLRWSAFIDLIASGAALLLCMIGSFIAHAADPSLKDLNYTNGVSITLAVCLLILSIFVEYPIEKEELAQKAADESIKPEDYLE